MIKVMTYDRKIKRTSNESKQAQCAIFQEKNKTVVGEQDVLQNGNKKS